MKLEDRSHEETERQERCAQSKAWALAKKHIQAERKRQGCIFLACRKVGSSKCLRKRARGESAYGQQERLWLCRTGDHEDIEESDDGDDGPTARCEQMKKGRYV